MKENKYKYIIERLFELSESGRSITFSEHMNETVIAWDESHDHINYYDGFEGKVESLLQILSRIECGNNKE